MSAKHRQIFGLALKVAIVLLAAGYIARRIIYSNYLFEIGRWFYNAVTGFPLIFLVVIALMFLNWMLEGWKWKLAAGRQVKISFSEAMSGVLAGVTIGTSTPNRVGEFAGRIFMHKKEDRVPLLFLSFVCSFCQVAVTILAGLAGIFLLESDTVLSVREMNFIYIAGTLICLSPLLLLVIPRKWNENITKLRTFPFRVFIKIFFLSAFRYMIYVTQFALLLYMTRAGWNIQQMLGGIMVSYLIVTIIPTFSITEVLVRGFIAGLVFSRINNLHDPVTVSIVIWLINVAVPSLVGSAFVFRLKFSRKEA